MGKDALWWNPFPGLVVASSPDASGQSKRRAVVKVDSFEVGEPSRFVGNVYYETEPGGKVHCCWSSTWRRWCMNNNVRSVVMN